jgi:hypothetical protein
MIRIAQKSILGYWYLLVMRMAFSCIYFWQIMENWGKSIVFWLSRSPDVGQYQQNEKSARETLEKGVADPQHIKHINMITHYAGPIVCNRGFEKIRSKHGTHRNIIKALPLMRGIETSA